MGVDRMMTPPLSQMKDDTTIRRYGADGLGIDPQDNTFIGGTHNVSVKIDPAYAVLGGYTPIPGDTMPSGAPAVGEGRDEPYFTKN